MKLFEIAQTMIHRVAFAALFAVSGVACSAIAPKDDAGGCTGCQGASCSCRGGGNCTTPTASSDCADGYLCDYYDPSTVFQLTGSKAGNYCRATCANCPSKTSCSYPLRTPTELCTPGNGALGVIFYPYTSFTGAAGTPIHMSVAASSQSPIVSFAWTFGDGQTGTGDTVMHPYATAGTYTATVTVTDKSTNTAQASAQVMVQ